MSAITRQEQDLLLALYVQPKASRDELVGLHGEELKLAITAPPVDGKANAHICKLLAKAFRVPKGKVSIERGELGRHKLVRIQAPEIIPDDFARYL
ncbi:DUF167 family protein YggU [Shewanella litorisediminis]|uniref:UPF0235 protein JQC75_12865 n=1 Tax=Shewanella litorisediminis TaxID=1173586 RepID=A0ABX7G0A8_9GAMM|nr:DUF167 family protein YggU [Shewanella litorisediminis]MCL2918180.1 DUF167 family protein YggU [Shewanella litorisediminis]QRH00765.1 YggU family protein [Shewanella litorisediminis]